MLNPKCQTSLDSTEHQRLLKAHQRPVPRLDVLEHLAQISEKVAIAGMDSSDGLADGIKQICQNSGVGALIDQSSLSLYSGLIKLAGLEKAKDCILYTSPSPRDGLLSRMPSSA